MRWGLATADADRFVLVGGVRPVPDEVVDAFRTLATQWSLAHASCGVHTELAHRAHHDQLTGLPNRTLSFQRLAAAVDAVDGDEHRSALLIVDLDDLKQVNDVHGHAAGDELLAEVAVRLAEVGADQGRPARFGGDEFALLVTGLDPPSEAAPNLTASDLMRCADIATYSAKARGKNRVERFIETGHGQIAQLRLLGEHLAHAVDRDEIVLHYQPHIDLRTGRCVGAEALARWQHPGLGLVPPGTFIPLAERTGHIIALGNHVLVAEWLAARSATESVAAD